MELNTDQLLENALRDGIREGVKAKLASGYGSPLDKITSSALEKHEPEIRGLLVESIGSCLDDAVFRNDIKTAVRSVLAKTLIQRFGGEMEKQVNALKSDPATRARITVAIEDILKSK